MPKLRGTRGRRAESGVRRTRRLHRGRKEWKAVSLPPDGRTTYQGILTGIIKIKDLPSIYLYLIMLLFEIIEMIIYKPNFKISLLL